MQVLLFAAFLSCVLRKPDFDDDEDSFDEGNGPLIDNDVAGGEERDMQGKKSAHICILGEAVFLELFFINCSKRFA